MGRTKELARSAKRAWTPLEKRRLVEFTLHKGAVVRVVAREHGVRPANLYRWRAQYRANELVDATPKLWVESACCGVLAGEHRRRSDVAGATSVSR